MTAASVALLAALFAAQPGGPSPRAEAVRRELSDVAARIERMKASGVRGGPAIEALLAKSQDLAAELERLGGRSRPLERVPSGADPQELRERADALRDEVDRLVAALADVDRRLRDEGRRRRARRLATLEEEGALFSEASPGRFGGGQRSSAASGPEVPEGPSGPQGPAGPTGPSAEPGTPPTVGPTTPPTSGPTTPPTSPEPTAPPVADPLSGSPGSPEGPSAFDGPPGDAGGASVAPGTHVWSAPIDSRSWTDRGGLGRGASETELRRRRDAILQAIVDAQRRIQQYEAEARELDSHP